MTTVAAEQLQPHGQEYVMPDYRTIETGTPAYFAALQNRWDTMRVTSYPEIDNPTDAEAFANSRRHTGDFLCAPETVDAVLQLAQEDQTLEAGQPAAEAVNALATMMGSIDTFRDQNGLANADDATVLAKMRTRFYRGDMTYAMFTQAFNTIREQGTAYLASRMNDIPADQTIDRYDGARRTSQNLREVAARAILKNVELEQGLQMNETFIQDLETTQALVLSLDINGATFTLPDQVTPNAQMISVVNEAINLLRHEYADTYPGQRAFIIPNTGMGGNYARGVIETAGPLISDAVFGESGGVEVVRNGDATSIELTLDHPDVYLMALKRIEQRVHGAVANREDMVTAPKDSMSSIMVRDPHTGGTLLRTEDGTDITEDHVRMMLRECAAEMLDEAEDPTYRAQLQVVLGKIVADYNPAVGFVDIHLAGVSKFFALNKFYERKGLTEADVTTVHIGDSTVDSPADNEARRAHIVALSNSKSKHSQKTAARGERGHHTQNEAIIGVINTVNGMIGALQEVKRRRAAAKIAA